MGGRKQNTPTIYMVEVKPQNTAQGKAKATMLHLPLYLFV